MLRILLLLAALIAAASAHAASLKIPRQVIEAGLKSADCNVAYEEATTRLDDPYVLGDGQELQEILCWRAAYQYAGIFFVYSEASPDQARLLTFRFPQVRGVESRSSVTSPEYDEKTKLLTSIHKGRGVGDCGSSGEWMWNGHDFLLQRYWLKVDCNGRSFNPKLRPKEWLVYPKKSDADLIAKPS
jgi:uncharacterized protein DUF1176